MECKHKWKTIDWKQDSCGCCGELEAICVKCKKTIDKYLYYWEIEKLNLDEEGQL